MTIVHAQVVRCPVECVKEETGAYWCGLWAWCGFYGRGAAYEHENVVSGELVDTTVPKKTGRWEHFWERYDPHGHDVLGGLFPCSQDFWVPYTHIQQEKLI